MDLKKEIESLNEYTDQNRWRKLKERVSIMNIHDERNNEIFDLAKEKGLI